MKEKNDLEKQLAAASNQIVMQEVAVDVNCQQLPLSPEFDPLLTTENGEPQVKTLPSTGALVKRNNGDESGSISMVRSETLRISSAR